MGKRGDEGGSVDEVVLGVGPEACADIADERGGGDSSSRHSKA